MTRYSVQLIFVKGYEFFSFAKNMFKNIGKNINKSLSHKHGQKLLDHAKQYATDATKTLQKDSFKKQQKQLVI